MKKDSSNMQITLYYYNDVLELRWYYQIESGTTIDIYGSTILRLVLPQLLMVVPFWKW